MTILRNSVARLLAGVLLTFSAFAWAEPTTLTFLHVNDVYEIAPKRGKGGFAPLMTILERERAASPHSITTFGGDLFSPSVMSGLHQGRPNGGDDERHRHRRRGGRQPRVRLRS